MPLKKRSLTFENSLTLLPPIIITKDNDIESLNKDKKKLQLSLHRVKYQMRQPGEKL